MSEDNLKKAAVTVTSDAVQPRTPVGRVCSASCFPAVQGRVRYVSLWANTKSSLQSSDRSVFGTIFLPDASAPTIFCNVDGLSLREALAPTPSPLHIGGMHRRYAFVVGLASGLVFAKKSFATSDSIMRKRFYGFKPNQDCKCLRARTQIETAQCLTQAGWRRFAKNVRHKAQVST